MTDHDPKQTAKEFNDAVNMTASELKRWLASDDSRSVGMTAGGERVTSPGGGEAVGHHMGERIVQIKATKQAALTTDDYADMRKVLGYIHRHMAQRPGGDVSGTRWRKSLMNWGHDPTK